MKKISFFIIAIIALTLSATLLHAQHLFSVNYNDISKENVTQLKAQMINLDIADLSLTKNNENKEVYPVALSSVKNTKIIILNEQTGGHVTITPVKEYLTEFQLAPFFIEELKQAVLGNANRYLVMEVDLNFLVKNVVAVSAAKRDVFIPQYFYGRKENVKEALPKDRQIIHIFKLKPRLIPASNDPENLRHLAQLEEAMSYYRYMFKLPDGTLCTYDEHYNPGDGENENIISGRLQFILSGNLNAEQTTATEHALTLWGSQLAGTIPVDINITSVDMGPGYLGAAWPQQHFLDPATNTYYHSPLWNQLVGYDATNLRDIRLEMNSHSTTFYYGTDGNGPHSRWDWVTIMLHEVCHGLGFAPLCREDGRYVYSHANGNAYYTDYPGIFDRQLYEGVTGNTRLTDLSVAGRQALIRSNNLYAGAPGSNLLTSNGGTRVKMHAPIIYQSGSSVSHWDSSVTFPTFMKFSIFNGWALHTFNTRKIGILLDMGWRQNLGITETQRIRSLQIIPNPASHTVELRVTNYELRVDKIEFYNIFGQLVKNVPFTGQAMKDEASQKIDISDLSAGVYMVKVGTEVVKLVVN